MNTGSELAGMITTTASVNSDQLDPPFPRTDQRTTRTTEELHPSVRPPALPSSRTSIRLSSSEWT